MCGLLEQVGIGLANGLLPNRCNPQLSSSATFDFSLIEWLSGTYLLAKVNLSFDCTCWPGPELFIESEGVAAAVNFGQTHGSKSAVLARAAFLIGVVALI